MTPPGEVHSNPKVDRTVSLYGWVRGTYLRPKQPIHLLGKHEAPGSRHRLEAASHTACTQEWETSPSLS